MDAVCAASDELCRNLTMSLELVGTLTEISREKEKHLSSGDIESLRAATDKEEELIADLGKLEKDRELYAGALSDAIGFFGNGLSLAELIEGIREAEFRNRLTDLRGRIKDAVNALIAQNDKVRQLIVFQLDLTEYMLNLIYSPKSINQTYGVQGSRMDEEGRTSLFDLHV